MINISMTWM